MHDALRVDDDFDLLGRQAEQQTRLDELETLVHQGGGIDRDLPPHRPVGMGNGLFRRCRRNGLARPVAEGTSGSCQQYATYTGGSRATTNVVWHALEDRVVLTVD